MIRNDDDLVDLLVQVFQSMPALVAAVGGAANIFAYKFNYPVANSLARAIISLKSPSLMVAHSETQILNRKDGITHRFRAYFKTRGNVGGIFVAMREDVPALVPGGLKFKHATIDEECDPPFVTGYAATSIVIDEHSAIDYHVAEIVLRERGIDD